jgi:hypothetical protein
LLLTLLERLGLPETDFQFFARFLSPPLLNNDRQPTRMRRGVPMAHVLSDLLAELVMRLLERHIHEHARVRIVRRVDDICLLTPDASEAVAAWRSVQDFCAACGLAVNQQKAGAVCLGGELPAGLPPGRPRWNMLELDHQGRWKVHQETFLAHLEQSRVRVTAADAVLSAVQLYNANADYLISSLALGAALGDSHRDSAESAVREFHHAFFGNGRGIVPGLGDTIRQRFLAHGSLVAFIPEGWMYWPITAGGLGLKNPLVIAGQYAGAYRNRPHPNAPETRSVGWNTQANEWAAYYEHLLERVDASEPEDTKVMKTLVEDFIARGSDISAGRQQGLTSYWRWILYTYGPQILQRFGTFRFLITELVPLQLISQQRVKDTSLDGGKQPAEGSDEAIAF